MPVKLAWVAFGLVPAVLFITACITWWARVVRRKRTGSANRAGEPAIPAIAEEGIHS
jgi:uncharacterized iron-regulated membrane protein